MKVSLVIFTLYFFVFSLKANLNFVPVDRLIDEINYQDITFIIDEIATRQPQVIQKLVRHYISHELPMGLGEEQKKRKIWELFAGDPTR